MDFFWNLFDQFRTSAVFTAIRGFSAVDWAFLFALLYGMAQGSRKGFSEMLGRFFVVLLTTLLTLTFYKPAARFLSVRIQGLPDSWSEFLCFFLLSVFFWITLSWVKNFAGKFFKLEAQGFLKAFGGTVLGVLWMLVLFSLVAQSFLLFPSVAVRNVFEPGRSYCGRAVAKLAPDLHALAVAPFQKHSAKQSSALPKAGG